MTFCKNGGRLNSEICQCECPKCQNNGEIKGPSSNDCQCQCKGPWKGPLCQICDPTLSKCKRGKLDSNCKCQCHFPFVGNDCEGTKSLLFTHSTASGDINNEILQLMNYLVSKNHQVSVAFITNPVCKEEPCPYEVLKAKLPTNVEFFHVGELIGGNLIGDVMLQRSYWAYDFLKRNEEKFNIVHFFDSLGFYSIKIKKMGLGFLNIKFVSIQRNPSVSIHEYLQNSTSNLADFKIGLYSNLHISNLFGDKYDQITNVKELLFYGTSIKHYYLFKKLHHYFSDVQTSYLLYSNNWIQNKKIRSMNLNDKIISLSIVDTPQKAFTFIQSGDKRMVVFLEYDDLASRLMNFGIPFMFPETQQTQLIYPPTILYPKFLSLMKQKIKRVLSNGYKTDKKLYLLNEKKWDEFYQSILNSFSLSYRTTPKSSIPVGFIIRVNSNSENLMNLASSITAQTNQNYEVALIIENNLEETLQKVREMKNLLRQFKKILRLRFSLNSIENPFNLGALLIPEASHYIFIESSFVILKPEFLENMLKVAYRENLDILSSFYDIMPEGRKYPWPWDDEFYYRKLFIGNILEGVIENYQSSNEMIMVKKSLIEKNKFENIEGCMIWNYMIKSIALGYKVDVIPMGLYWIRNFILPKIEVKKKCSERISKNFKEFKQIEGMTFFEIGKFYQNNDW